MTKGLPLLAMLAVPMLCIGAAAALPASQDAAPVGHRLAAGVGYATAVRLSHQPAKADNGRLLLAFEPSDPGQVPLFESRDNGEHWHKTGEVGYGAQGDPAHWSLRWQPHLSEIARTSGDLPAGTLLLAANAIERNAQGQLSGQDLQLYASRDGGRRWEYRSSIIQGRGQPSDRLNQGVWEPYIVILDDGRMVAFYSSEQHKQQGFNQLLAHKVSPDGGRTWSAETYDVALPGGVERPGMAIVERVPGRGYAMVFENIDNTDGPRNGQVHLKFSRDGLDWGPADDRGIAIQTASGAWPSACPTIRWLPGPTADGVLIVAAQRAGGGGDTAGRTFYRNDTGGRGPWWETVAPVQKQAGNIHAGWTQALLPNGDGTLLHITSSSVASAPAEEQANQILYASAPLALNRYEAEDAQRRRVAQIEDPTASAGRKVRVARGADADLEFDIQRGQAGRYRLRVRYADIGFAAVPQVQLNGHVLAASPALAPAEGWRVAEFDATLQAGGNRVVVSNPAQALDYDYLDLDPVLP